MHRVLRLLEEQRLRSQALLAKSSERESVSEQKESFAAVMSATPLAVLPMLDDLQPSQALLLKDMNGMNLLHVSARLGCWEVMDRLLALNSQLCDQMTSPVGRPAHWSPLMVLVDAGQARDPDTFRYMLGRLLQETSLTTIEARAANGTSALHMAAGRGMFNATKQILYAVYNKNNAGMAAFGLVTSLLNTPNGRGAGCVSGLRFLIRANGVFGFGCVVFFDIACMAFSMYQVDLALRCNVELAMYLQNVWKGRPLLPPPPGPHSRDSNTQWFERNPWYTRNRNQ